MRVKIKVWLVLLFSALLLAPPLFAQDVPENAKAGVVERTLDEVAAPVEASKAKENLFQELEYPQTALNLSEDKEITVSGFEFTGNTIFTSAKLGAVLSRYTRGPIRLSDLQEACQTVNTYYRNKGFFLTRAILPEQDITAGIVTIQVIEGQLGEVMVQGNEFYNSDFIKNHFACTTKGVINYHRLLKSLMVLNGYPDLQVRAVMQKGTAPYTVDVVLTAVDKRPIHFFVDYNNFGSRYVSKHRSGLGVEYSNLAVAGDKLTVRGVTGSPLQIQTYARADYSLPVNQYGTRAGISYAWSSFDVQREFRQLDAGGTSYDIGLEVTHPLKKTLTSSMDITAGFDYSRNKNYLLGDISTDDKLRVFKLGLSGDILETGLGARDFYDLTVSEGVPNILGGSERNDSMASRSGAGGKFTKANLDLARYQQLPWGVTLLVKGSGQVASDVLPVSEQFSIGGLNTVRGFSESEHLGDMGTVQNAELIAPPPFISDNKVPFMDRSFRDFMQLVAFVDHGTTYLKNALVGESKNSEIAGAGFGTRLNFGSDLNVRLEVGFPIAGAEASSGDKTVTYLQVLKKF